MENKKKLVYRKTEKTKEIKTESIKSFKTEAEFLKSIGINPDECKDATLIEI